MPPPRILVADDSEVFRDALCTLLRRLVDLPHIATAQDGEEALQYIAETTPDLLILDINMPKVNGWEVLRQLRSSASAVNVLVLTAHANPDLATRALHSGANAWVPKGDIPLFIDTLRRLLPAE